MSVTFGIVTPTYNRPALLRRHLRRMSRQTYRRWRLLVMHDGPNPSIRSMVEGFTELDPRIAYSETEVSARNAGLTPRLRGIEQLAKHSTSDYLLSWDDDNAYAVDALERIAAALETVDWPDLLLVCVRYGSKIIPPPEIPVRALKVGQVDTACMVFRPSLAGDAYANVHRQWNAAREKSVRFDDFLAFQYVAELTPPKSIVRDCGVLVCQHDGLRWGPSIRIALGIPPLGLARLIGLGR